MDFTEYRLRAHYGRLGAPEAPATPVQEPVEQARGFVLEVGNKTIFTAPAGIDEFQQDFEKAFTPNEHFLWMSGRFVGAEKPNRNGAFWATQDLELGEMTVRHGPLNWLHEGHHVIGTIADSRFVLPDETAAESQAGIAEPHIVATSAIWKWLYPNEAAVVQMAAEQKSLYYSMECISRSVACMADGCGKSFPYAQTVNDKASVCAHIRDRSAARHFQDPTFLGGAVIVPPVKPGWADADATVMRQAAKLAEENAEFAGELSASEWEQMMASVLRFAEL